MPSETSEYTYQHARMLTLPIRFGSETWQLRGGPTPTLLEGEKLSQQEKAVLRVLLRFAVGVTNERERDLEQLVRVQKKQKSETPRPPSYRRHTSTLTRASRSRVLEVCILAKQASLPVASLSPPR